MRPAWRTISRLGLPLLLTALAGCGGATATAPRTSTPSNPARASSGAASFIGQATNAEILIQWTRSGNDVSGSLQEVIRKAPGSRQVESPGRAFTGTISGNGLTLTLNGGLGSASAIVGTLGGNGFELTLPGEAHRLVTVSFVPGTVADFNHAVLEIEGKAEQGPSDTTDEHNKVHVGPNTPSDREVREELRRMRDAEANR